MVGEVERALWTLKQKLRILFCIPLGLHYFADAKIGGASGIKTKTSYFVLYSARLALSLQII